MTDKEIVRAKLEEYKDSQRIACYGLHLPWDSSEYDEALAAFDRLTSPSADVDAREARYLVDQIRSGLREADVDEPLLTDASAEAIITEAMERVRWACAEQARKRFFALHQVQIDDEVENSWNLHEWEELSAAILAQPKEKP